MAKKSGRRAKKHSGIGLDYDASGANAESANADTTEDPKGETSRAHAASGKRKAASHETKAKRNETDFVNDSLLTVVSANLEALRGRVQAEADAGHGDRAARKRAKLSKESDTVIETGGVLAALNELEAAYREMLQH